MVQQQEALKTYWKSQLLWEMRNEIGVVHCNVGYAAEHLLAKPTTGQKMKFSIKDFFSKYAQICSKLHFLCSVHVTLSSNMKKANQSINQSFL